MSLMDPDQPRVEAIGEAGGGRAAWAYEMLHDAIREGTIEPGQRLMELEVSAWLKMSRTPVREAMRRLQAEGMLEHAAGGGMSVVLYDLRAIDEFYAMRERLEGTAAALAAQTGRASSFEKSIITFLVCKNSSNAATPRSLPKPDSLNPPKTGHGGDDTIGIDPDRTGVDGTDDPHGTRKICGPPAKSSGQIHVAFGMLTASSSVSNGMMESTGPNISSRAMVMSLGDIGENRGLDEKSPNWAALGFSPPCHPWPAWRRRSWHPRSFS